MKLVIWAPHFQAKILRVLESGEIERVGGAETHTVNVRVISATNQDLNEKIKEGKFREDLFHRINVFPVTLPPLRERKVDIPLLTYAIFKTLKKKHNLSVSYIGPKAIDRLIDYSWPGNVRELENTLERALLICNNKYLTEDDLGSVLDEKETAIEAQKEPVPIEAGDQGPTKINETSINAVSYTHLTLPTIHHV